LSTWRHPLRAVSAGPTALALCWLVAAGLALLGPALAKGAALGPYDLLRVYGLGRVPGVTVHNAVSSDQIQLFLPWTTLAWNQVHHGQLPLWNPYNALGMPLAFNWESAPFSLPALVSYLVPVRFAFDAAMAVRLVLAGSGTFVLCRVLGTGVLPATFAGTVYELSGGFSVWLGWSTSGVLALMGWVLAGAVLIIRGDRRVSGVILLAVSLAFSVYGGYPESTVDVLIALGLFACAMVLWRPGRRGEDRAVRRPLLGVAIGTLAGLGLSAPLVLPGAQLALGSVRTVPTPAYAALSAHDMVLLAFQGFDGLPMAGSHYFGDSNYYATASYVGVTVLVLAAVAVARRWRRPEVAGLALVSLACLAIVYVEPFARLADHVPEVGSLYWGLATIPLDLVLAVLAALGLEEVIRPEHERGAIRVLAWTWMLAAVVLAVLFLHVVLSAKQLSPADAHERLWSFAWPAGQVASGLVATGALVRYYRSRAGQSRKLPISPACAAAGVFLLVETGFLVWAGAPLWSSSPASFAATPAEVSLQHIVGAARAGFGSCPSGVASFTDLGILPDANAAYGVSEFALYDPSMPRAYLQSWAAATRQPSISQLADPLGVFCPAVTDVAEARRYGITFILEPRGVAGPPGTHLVATPGGEGLFRVDNVSLATDGPIRASSRSPAIGTILRVDRPDADTWRVDLDEAHRSVVYLRLTDVPGWQATIDGRPLAVKSWQGVMIQVDVPAGRYVLVLHYWPTAFTAGLVLAVITAILLLAAAIIAHRGARRSRAVLDGRPDRSAHPAEL